MQLRTLTVQALGPFAGLHEVDFAALAASGLFLLDGRSIWTWVVGLFPR